MHAQRSSEPARSAASRADIGSTASRRAVSACNRPSRSLPVSRQWITVGSYWLPVLGMTTVPTRRCDCTSPIEVSARSTTSPDVRGLRSPTTDQGVGVGRVEPSKAHATAGVPRYAGLEAGP